MKMNELKKKISVMMILLVIFNLFLPLSSNFARANDFSNEPNNLLETENNLESNVTIENFAVVPRDSEIELWWMISEDGDEEVSISHYNLTKNGEHLDKVEYDENTYLDEDVANRENYTYQLEVIDEEGNVLASEESYGSPESYWWIGLSASVNIIALLVVVFIIFKKRTE